MHIAHQEPLDKGEPDVLCACVSSMCERDINMRVGTHIWMMMITIKKIVQ